MHKFDDVLSITQFLDLLYGTSEWACLNDKTQVFNERVSEDVKSRGSHCDDVGQISFDLAKALGGSSVECSRARLIGEIHDLGHIAYGHAGEAVADRILKDYLKDKKLSPEEQKTALQIRELMLGKKYNEGTRKKKKDGTIVEPICFEHNENSVLRYMVMCRKFGFEVDKDIITGILAHSTSRYADLPPKLSQQAVRLADKLAYINYDISDMLISFEHKPEEMKALDELYSKPLLDPDGKEIKIELPDGRSLTIYEFIHLESNERVNLFVSAAVNEAQERAKNKPDEYREFETVLTGCNDLVVQIAKLRKKASDKSISPDEKAKYEAEIKEKNRELYARSPILYAAYEIKARSDEFIRAYEGLSLESKIDRSKNSLSAVGNKDFLNEYVYKILVENLKREIAKNVGLSDEEVRKRYEAKKVPKEYIDLYFDYLKFREEECATLLAMPGNDDGLVYPEIYTIVNFIGSHSNSQLNRLAEIAHLEEKFNQEVVPQIQALLDDPSLYDPKTGLFTKSGREKREELVNKYGSEIELKFGMEEESHSPLVSEERIAKTIDAGYSIEGYEKNDSVALAMTSDSSKFDAEKAKADAALNNAGEALGNVVVRIASINEEKVNRSTPRK